MLVYHQFYQADEKMHQQFPGFIGRLMGFSFGIIQLVPGMLMLLWRAFFMFSLLIRKL